MNRTLRSALRLLAMIALVAFGVRMMRNRTRVAKPQPKPSIAALMGESTTVAVVHDTGSAVRGPALEFGDTTAATERAKDDAAMARAMGQGLTTKQTYTAPLYPETRGRAGSGNP